MLRKLILGTRRSLLAWAQSSWVARELERLNPGLQVELFGIDTRGDKIQDVPLSEVQGKEFFVAELDDALREGRVDLNVHSMKDLSLERPPEFVCGAIPRRENPRDVILFGPRILESLEKGRKIRIGTSAPRRQENIPPFLRRALPRRLASEVELVEIRGNVNTRLARVHEPWDSSRYLDGVVLAFAGLIRLWADPAARQELTRLLVGARWMVLPLRECPTAPGQGALAVECRASDSFAREAIAKMHHAPTAEQVLRERKLLEQWGGGCHQRFGATAITSSELGELFFVRGVRGTKPDHQFVDEFHWNVPPPTPSGMHPIRPWDGPSKRNITPLITQIEDLGIPVDRPEALFVSHSRALPAGSLPSDWRVWTSGVQSWFRMAERGIWVEGCAEGLGFEELVTTLREPVLCLPPFEDWKILTHEAASRGWSAGQVISTYRIEEIGDPREDALRSATHVFWSSGSQWDLLNAHVGNQVLHACGPGKTARYLREQGVKPIVFPSPEEWRKWISGV